MYVKYWTLYGNAAPWFGRWWSSGRAGLLAKVLWCAEADLSAAGVPDPSGQLKRLQEELEKL